MNSLDLEHRANTNACSANLHRLRVQLHGAVQGVGFRPFIYRLAQDLGLKGWVENSNVGVIIEVEGADETLQCFLTRLETDKPEHSFIQSMETFALYTEGFTGFEIRESEVDEHPTTIVLPDIAPCPECLKEIADPSNRRYRYPFTNCTHCGPRFSIIEKLPYDRENTSMQEFKMCKVCQKEYDAPLNRRFHAQPNACPTCGPQLTLLDEEGGVKGSGENALDQATESIKQSKIVAVKGVGGFHLVCNSLDEESVKKLRQRKRKSEKPFALMCFDLEMVNKYCEVSQKEERLLLSPEAPIVLLKRKIDGEHIGESVAARNPYLGVMLPSSPLHYLLLSELGCPIVATSGNLAEEPLIIDNDKALEKLSGIVDCFLMHNRKIVRHIDDSIVRIMGGRESVIRRARGYAPLPLALKATMPSLLGVGAHMKNAVAIAQDKNIFVSQHIGDLETQEAIQSFRKVIDDFENLYDLSPSNIACDEHPDFESTQFAHKSESPITPVQHHLAHVYACMAENQLEGDVLGVAWDGTGLGSNGQLWGGEFFDVSKQNANRVATFRPFRLLGGEKAIQDPKRIALSLLYELNGAQAFEDKLITNWFAHTDLKNYQVMLEKGIQSPYTSSVGRLFDGVSALLGLCHQVSYEGQAAMQLEFAIEEHKTDLAYPFRVDLQEAEDMHVIDWLLMLDQIRTDLMEGVPLKIIAAKFHNALALAIVAVAEMSGNEKVALSGGCFQNKYLVEKTIQLLRKRELQPYWHQRIPTNDGGIALGQIVGATRILKEQKKKALLCV